MKVDKSRWHRDLLGNLCNIKRGGSPRPIQKFLTDAPDGINWIKIGDAGDSKFISSCKEKIIPEGVSKSRFVHKGDFLLSNSMSFGRPYILNVDGCIHDGWLVLEQPKQFDKSYLYYLLGSAPMYEKFTQKAQGAVVNNLNIDRVASVEIIYPPLDIQQAIAAELDAVQAMIDGYKAQLEDLDALAQSIFLDMFGDPVSNPKGWEKGSLNKYASIGTGATPSRKIVSYYEGDIPWVKSTEVHNSYIWETQEHITKEAIDNSNCSIYLPDTILVAMYGQGKTRGQVGLLRIKAATNQACAAIQCKDSLNPTFCYWHFQMCYEANRELGNGTNQKNMNLTIVGNIKFIIPPLSLQQEFAFKIESIEKQKELICKQLEDAKTMMAERMQYYFS